MKKITIDMPVVGACAVTNCAYNVNKNCHAKAITVGDSTNPGCDTFFDGSKHSRNTQITAGVGACKVSICKYNNDYECMAESIQVDKQQNQVRCMTFTQRP